MIHNASQHDFLRLFISTNKIGCIIERRRAPRTTRTMYYFRVQVESEIWIQYILKFFFLSGKKVSSAYTYLLLTLMKLLIPILLFDYTFYMQHFQKRFINCVIFLTFLKGFEKFWNNIKMKLTITHRFWNHIKIAIRINNIIIYWYTYKLN